jgi:hypothetical protein
MWNYFQGKTCVDEVMEAHAEEYVYLLTRMLPGLLFFTVE